MLSALRLPGSRPPRREVAALAIAAGASTPAGSAAPGTSEAKKKAKLPTIAVVGRPNVGKSTIFNRMTAKFERGAIVFDEPGVTRDRTYGDGWWDGYDFTAVDTGGIVYDDNAEDVFIPQIREQALLALAEAHAAVLVVDGQAGRWDCNMKLN